MNYLATKADQYLGKKETEAPSRPETSGEQMKAIVWNGGKSVSVSTVPKPAITHPEDCIVKVTSCTVCTGSDSHVYAGEIPDTKKGQILGHEGMGIVEEVGEEVTKVKKGDRVVLAFDIACGKCEYCKRKEYVACSKTNDSKLNEEMFSHGHAAIFGYGDLLGGVPGSQAEYVRVPYCDVNCCVVPSDMPDEKALYISDVLCTSLHAVTMGEVKEGDSVCIFGLGPIGLLSAKWAKLKGASKVIGIDFVTERLDLAKKIGIETIDRNNLPKNSTVVEEVLKILPEGADCTIEAAGFRYATSLLHRVERAVGLETDTSEILNECISATRKFGHLSIIGDYAGYTNHFFIGGIMFKHLTVRSGQCPCQKYFDEVLEALKKGDMDPSFLITQRVSFDELPNAYEKLFKKSDGYVKIFCDMTK